jgi:hypothetical protein
MLPNKGQGRWTDLVGGLAYALIGVNVPPTILCIYLIELKREYQFLGRACHGHEPLELGALDASLLLCHDPGQALNYFTQRVMPNYWSGLVDTTH